MEIQELTEKLKEFDPRHIVMLEITTDDGTVTHFCSVLDVQFKYGDCVLIGSDH